jgi:phage terminase large subunit-like protein
VIAAEPIKTAYTAGYRGLLAFCEAIGETLEPHERRIARAHFGEAREVYGVLPRGNLKTSLAAKIGVHHLLTVPGAAVTIGAASRDQARICFERMRGFAQHPALEDDLIIRHLELRHEEETGHLRLLRVVPSDGPRVHGLSSSLYIGDEIWAWKGDDLLEAMLTGLVKNPEARFLGISTAAARLDSPLARARARALAGDVTRKGVVIDATAPGLRWLEWSLPEERELDDFEAVKQCNPARYITRRLLREQKERVGPLAWAQFHCCRWGVGEMSWLPPDAWSACAGETRFEEGERIWCAIDLGGSRSASALVYMNERLHVGSAIFSGDDGPDHLLYELLELAKRFKVVEIVFDPIRSVVLQRILEQHGLKLTVFQQTDTRMCPASAALYEAIVKGKITHPNDETLNRHVACAIAKPKPRGWRIDKAVESDNVDGVIAMAMCLEAATAPPPPRGRVVAVW